MAKRPNIDFSGNDFDDEDFRPRRSHQPHGSDSYSSNDPENSGSDSYDDYDGYDSNDDYDSDDSSDSYDSNNGNGYDSSDRYDISDSRYADRRARDPRYPRDDRDAPRHPRDSYRDGYRDGYRDNAADADRRRSFSETTDNSSAMDLEAKAEKAKGFFRRHPVMMNFIYVCAASAIFICLAMWFLDYWTFHGQERSVPDVKGQSFEMASGNITRAGLRCVVTDSVYDSYARPGTVVEQMPIPNARIKNGGAVYVTIVAYTPKMVTIPDFYDVSERQARSMLEGLGIKQVMTVRVPSEYEGLVLGARFNGVSLRPGAKVPVTAVITLEVGGGSFDTALPDSDSEAPITDEEAIDQTIETLDID